MFEQPTSDTIHIKPELSLPLPHHKYFTILFLLYQSFFTLFSHLKLQGHLILLLRYTTNANLNILVGQYTPKSEYFLPYIC